jgi:hypothetical protein
MITTFSMSSYQLIFGAKFRQNEKKKKKKKITVTRFPFLLKKIAKFKRKKEI